jgi:hypothetical protein
LIVESSNIWRVLRTTAHRLRRIPSAQGAILRASMGIFIRLAVVFVDPTGPTMKDWNFSDSK